jgi:hypothetical protein
MPSRDAIFDVVQAIPIRIDAANNGGIDTRHVLRVYALMPHAVVDMCVRR